MALSEIRREIDAIDAELTKLLVRRLTAVDALAAEKRAGGLPVVDGEREREVLGRVAALAGAGCADDAGDVFRQIISVSRRRQLAAETGKRAERR